jgi:hypothetical protein
MNSMRAERAKRGDSLTIPHCIGVACVGEGRCWQSEHPLRRRRPDCPHFHTFTAHVHLQDGNAHTPHHRTARLPPTYAQAATVPGCAVTFCEKKTTCGRMRRASAWSKYELSSCERNCGRTLTLPSVIPQPPGCGYTWEGGCRRCDERGEW